MSKEQQGKEQVRRTGEQAKLSLAREQATLLLDNRDNAWQECTTYLGFKTKSLNSISSVLIKVTQRHMMAGAVIDQSRTQPAGAEWNGVGEIVPKASTNNLGLLCLWSWKKNWLVAVIDRIRSNLQQAGAELNGVGT